MACWNCVISGNTTEMLVKANYVNHQHTRDVTDTFLANSRVATSPNGWYPASAYHARKTTALLQAIYTDTPVRYVADVASDGHPI